MILIQLYLVKNLKSIHQIMNKSFLGIVKLGKYQKIQKKKNIMLVMKNHIDIRIIILNT